MIYLYVAILFVIAAMMFLMGFVSGCKATKSYLKERGLLIEQQQASRAPGCQKGGNSVE